MYEVKIYRPNQDKNLKLFKIVPKEEVKAREIAKILKVDEFKMTYRESIYALYQISLEKEWKHKTIWLRPVEQSPKVVKRKASI